jgi:hypothetical protein
MPPTKRKAQSQIPDRTEKPAKKQQIQVPEKLEKIRVEPSAPTHADFGSAFASLLAEPAPKASPVITSSVSTNATATTVTKTTQNNKTTPIDPKKKFPKGKQQQQQQHSDEEDHTTAGIFAAKKAEMRNKRKISSAAVVTVTREDSDKLQLSNQYSKLQKQREHEKSLLFEKDHVVPKYDDTEKQLVRIATKGVVALFQAVFDQTQKFKEIQRNQQLSTTSRDKIINEETQSGFLELLKQASENTARSEPVFVPGNRKKISDLKSKLEQDHEIGWDDLKGLGLSDGDDEKIDSNSSKYARGIANKNKLGLKNAVSESDDDDDDESENEDKIPKFRKQALQRQKAQKDASAKKSSMAVAKGNAKWSVLDDDYIQTKSSGKMKDWEKDETSDSDL